MDECDVVVVGGGQAGVSLSWYLQRLGIGHLVLERDRAFSSWRNRWDGFRANTPNWMNTLSFLGDRLPGTGGRHGFATRDELVAYFDAGLDVVRPPLREGVNVTGIRPLGDGGWVVRAGDSAYRAKAVAICSGAMSTPRYPPGAAEVPAQVPQIHSSAYRSPDQVKTGSVLIVGTASSGVQICRLLSETGKFDRVHLSQSKVLELPKAILGVPTHRFIHAFGLFDVRTRSLLGRMMYSGLETKGDPIMRPNPEDLHKLYGTELYGKFTGFSDGRLRFDDGASLAPDDLTIVWCTGLRPDFGFLDFENRDAAFLPNGYPRHVRGVVGGVPGLYFVGLRYQHTVASHDIYGVARDAEFVAGAIRNELARGKVDA